MSYTVPRKLQVGVNQLLTGANPSLFPTSLTHFPVGADGILVTRIKVKLTAATTGYACILSVKRGATVMGTLDIPVAVIGTVLEGELTTAAEIVGRTNSIFTRSTGYKVGDIVRPSATTAVDMAFDGTGFGKLYQCIVEGTSASGATPTWPTTAGLTVAETTGVTWRCIGDDPGCLSVILSYDTVPDAGNATVTLIGSLIPQ